MAKNLDSTGKVVTAGQGGHNRVEIQDSGGNVISQTKVNERDKYGSGSQIVHSTHDSTGQTSHTTIHGNDHVNEHAND
jgi:hypothetical protein